MIVQNQRDDRYRIDDAKGPVGECVCESNTPKYSRGVLSRKEIVGLDYIVKRKSSRTPKSQTTGLEMTLKS